MSQWFYFKLKDRHSWSSHLVQAAGGTVFPPWGQIPELYIQETNQLVHGADWVGDVPSIQMISGLFRQLSSNIGSCFSRL